MEILATAYRGEIKDLYTFGVVVLVDSSGKIIYEKGDSRDYAYPRSSAKLMQTVAPLSLGAKEHFALTNQEISQICSSHSGEDIHISTVKNILNKIGLDESYLKCGAHYPFKEEIKNKMQKNKIKPTAIHNNCSGKHSGMLAGAILLNENLKNYTNKDSKIQNYISDIIATMCEIKKEDIKIGIDGCSVPVHALPIRNFAYGMAKMCDYKTLPQNLQKPAKNIIESVYENPVYTSGTDRLDYYIMGKSSEKVIVKSGANGYFGGCLPDRKQGFAIKCYHAEGIYRNIILIEFLKKLGIIDTKDYQFFDKKFDNKIYNHRKMVVGEIKCKL